ncbi:hypothetical protein JY651_18925 [Pyxidicoccus parkwayensis]|uniref:Uncharacterized protein n=1 Tax=Pyxidicoccus parkwayensis TaxID=2813578 RepID=A0ABX7P8M0_9BACT|nr:hypothetical protein [Pyxidicoccus parkwaysis]QSQ26859.1 hypothetical protein JY651_18925 [Pyxidicoccus parkwaysis]
MGIGLPKISLPKPKIPNPINVVKKGVEVVGNGAKAVGNAGAHVVKDGFDAAKTGVKTAVDITGKGIQAQVDLLHAGADVAKSAVKAGGRFALGAAEVAIDAQKKTLDLVGDVAQAGGKAAFDAVKFAAKEGLKLGDKLQQKVHDAALDGIDKATGLDGKIKDLGPGDSMKLSGKVGVAAELDVELKGEFEIKREKDGKYVVSGEAGAGVGLGAGAAAHVTAGGKVEYKFDNAEDAKKGALILAGAGATAANPVLGAALAPRPDDVKFLNQHLSSVEIKGGVDASVDASFGGEVGAGASAGASAGAAASASYKLEFENGKPKALVRTMELEVSGKAEASVELFGKLGKQTGTDAQGNPINDSLQAFSGVSGEVKGKVAVETKIPLDSAKIGDWAAFAASPTTAAFAGAAETTIKGELTGDGGDVGVKGDFELSGLSGKEVQTVAGRLLHGDFGHALDGVKVDTKGSWGTFTDKELGIGVDAKTGGAGVEVSVSGLKRDYTERGSFGSKAA